MYRTLSELLGAPTAAGAVSKETFLDLSLGNLICGRPSVEATFFTLKFGIGTWQAQFLRKIFWT